MAKSMLPVTRSSGPLSIWDPFRELDDLHERMNQLMSSVFGSPTFRDGGGLAWTPAADVTETEDTYLVEVDLPGVKREDINVETRNSTLIITGEYRQKERTGWLRSQTRRMGRFDFRTTLPPDVNTDAITAELSDGVLTVRVPKTEQAKPRRIEITGR